jgi:hypothetical protein
VGVRPGAGLPDFSLFNISKRVNYN